MPSEPFELKSECFYSCLKLEDLKVLKRSPDLLYNVKIGQDQLRLIMKHICFMGVAAFWSSDLKQSNEYSIKQPSDF